MSIRIAIPEPHSTDHAYNDRSLPPYLHALQSAGATPILIPLHESPARVAKLLSTVHGVLLPGSGADVDPQSYGEARLPECGPSDPARAAVDELLIQDAFNLHKPILAICHGTQTLNVWRNGSLIQDIPTALVLANPVNHSPGRSVTQAHPIQITPHTRLALIAQKIAANPHDINDLAHIDPTSVWVNSSHHQAIKVPGDNLVINARSPQDGVIEGVELASTTHFVLAVQWHPERTYTQRAFSRAIFAAFIQAASHWQPRPILESISQ